MIARILAHRGILITVVDPAAEGNEDWLPSGNGRIGCIIMDTKNNLGISEEAFGLLKTIDHGFDSLGDVMWFEADGNKRVFGWMGQPDRLMKPENVEGDRDFHVTDDHWNHCIKVPNDVPEEARNIIDKKLG